MYCGVGLNVLVGTSIILSLFIVGCFVVGVIGMVIIVIAVHSRYVCVFHNTILK